MRTSEIAKKAQIHPNTVRLYEEWKFISPVPRKENGYREYSEVHLQQLYIARLAFKQEFIQNNLRKKATEIVLLSGKELFHKSLLSAKAYLSFLYSEYDYMTKAIQSVDKLLHEETTNLPIFTHKEACKQLQLTEETVRNWERNGLFAVSRNAQNRRQYAASDMQKLLIIRTLRSAHFSIASILHFFEEIESVNHVTNIQSLLSSAKFKDEFYHVTDELEVNLKKAMNNVKLIIAILEKLQ